MSNQLANPLVNKAFIRQEIVLEDSTDPSSTTTVNVLCLYSSQRYEIGEILKKSIYGVVVHGIVLQHYTPSSDSSNSIREEAYFVRTNQEVAIKIYDKKMIVTHLSKSREQPLNEMAVLQYLSNALPGNSFVSTQLECCADDKHLYSVMPWIPHSELFDYIVDNGKLSEDEARSMFRSLMMAIYSLHRAKIAHRDISLENLMYNPENHTVEVIDFGMAKPMFHRSIAQTGTVLFDTKNEMCGKANYMPPEVVRGDSMVDPFAGDLWAAAICLFYSLLGFPPVERATYDDQRYALLMSGQVRELLHHWQADISEDTIDFVMYLLQEDPSQRPSINKILSHPWMTKVSSSHSVSLVNMPSVMLMQASG